MIKASLLTLLLAAGSGVTSRAQHVFLDGPAKAETYNDPAGSTGLVAVSDLTGNPSYPDSPDKTVNVKYLEYPNGPDDGSPPPGNVADNYGLRITGFIKVDKTGNYVFYSSSDDNSEFYLSTDDTAANLAPITSEPNWNPVRTFASTSRRDANAPENRSAPIALEVGKKYFFQGLMKEGGGGDNFSVAARAEGDQPASDGSYPIFIADVSANITITSQPKSVSGVEGQTASFTVGTSGPAFYQWLKGGTEIPGATSASYTTDALALTDEGNKYSVKVTGADGKSVTSTEATLHVVGTRLYTQGALRFDFWDAQTAIDGSLLGNPIGSYSAGGGTDPDQTGPIDAFDSRAFFPDDSHDNYDGAITGYFLPDQDGTYYFHLKSDDPGQLFLAVDPADATKVLPDVWPDPVNDTPVANETGCCNDFQPGGNVRTGGPFTLQKGKKYAMIGLYHEGGGNDYLQVAFTRDGSTASLNENDTRNPSTIPAKYLAAPGAGIVGPDLAITAQPQDLSVVETRTGTFTVGTTAAPGITYQWQSAPKGSSTFTDIAGATSASYTVTSAPALDGTQYRVKLHAEGQDVTSEIAKLIVLPDTVAPTITQAFTAPNLDAVVVSFSEPVKGTDTATYTLTGGATVTTVDVASPTVVVLHTAAPLTPSTSYTLTATGIKDLSFNGGNDLNPNTFTFTSGKLYTFPAGAKVPGYATFKRYNDVADDGQALTDAINDPTVIPDVTDLVSLFEIPVNASANYASIKTGWFVPPKTGNYVFFSASDDPSHLYLSTDSDPVNKKLIAQENAWANTREWTVSAGGSDLNGKRSDRFTGTQWPTGNTISLVGGEAYYIEQRHHEGGGGDNAAATYKLASDPDPANGSAPTITGNVIFTYAELSIATQPESVTVEENRNATFSVAPSFTAGITYQWQVAAPGGSFADIPGATSQTYTLKAVKADDGKRYRVVVSALGQALTSAEAVLTVSGDVTAPTIVSAGTLLDQNGVLVRYSEAVNAAAGTAGNYSLGAGTTITGVDILNPNLVFVHTAAPLTAAGSYTLTINNVKDIAATGGNDLTPNTITFNASAAPPAGTFVPGQVIYERWNGGAGGDLDAARATIDSTAPDFSGRLTTFISPVNVEEPAGTDLHYTGRLRGYFVPPVTGDYVFYHSSDDHGRLYLSTDSDPANIKIIAAEPVWNGSASWNTTDRRNAKAPENRSNTYDATEWPDGHTISLEGGQKYYIEDIWDETGGGDDGGATFQLVSDGPPADGVSRITGPAIGNYLDIAALPPFITGITPGPIVYAKGDKITLQATAIGSGTLTYQWYRNKIAITGATSASYVINSADYGDVGDYYVKVTNANGSADTRGVSGNAVQQDDILRLIMKGAFIVEAEDFNYEGGKHVAASDVMPYAGDAYKGLIPVNNVDFFNGPDESTANAGAYTYDRFKTTDPATVEIKGPGDNVNSAIGRLRGDFSVTANYAVGWTGGTDWQNYTRVLPAGKYAIIAAMAHDGYAAVTDTGNRINASLQKVANPTVADGSTATVEGGQQGLTKLGDFIAADTGAWSSNDFIPLADASGNPVLVDLGGETTLRWEVKNGDADFLLLYNTASAPPSNISITKAANGNITITFEGGALQSATSILGPFTPVAGATSPYSTAPSDAARFFIAR